MLRITRCVLVTILGTVLVFGCDPGPDMALQICNSKAVAMAKEITDRLMQILANTTKLDYLKVRVLSSLGQSILHLEILFFLKCSTIISIKSTSTNMNL
jgi:hypothetical protein